jgi:threonine/homoserine/homoserine lactone efflux protein
MYLEAGIIINDAFCILISYLGLAQVFQNPKVSYYVGIAGGLMLIFIGIKTYFSHRNVGTKLLEVNRTSPRKLMIRGFLVNMGNPSVLFFWLGAVGIAVSQFGDKPNSAFYILVYFSGTLVTYFGFDILKIYLAHKVKKFLTPKMFSIINKIAGIVIFIFGVILLIRVLFRFSLF